MSFGGETTQPHRMQFSVMQLILCSANSTPRSPSVAYGIVLKISGHVGTAVMVIDPSMFCILILLFSFTEHYIQFSSLTHPV